MMGVVFGGICSAFPVFFDVSFVSAMMCSVCLLLVRSLFRK